MQQINLYSNLPHPVKSILDARSLLVLCGVFCLMLILSYGVGLLQKHHDTSKLAAASKEVQLSKDHLTLLAAQYPSAARTAITPDMAKLEYCKFKFSDYLQTLATAIVPGVWLTDITVANRGQTVVLKGHALVEAQVQLYAEQLNNQLLFRQTPLTLQLITNETPDDATKSDGIDFQIATKAAQNG